MAETRTNTMPEMSSTPPVFERRDDRGIFREIVNRGPWESVITAAMRRGAVLGHHYHRETRIYLYISRGAARVSTVEMRSGTRRCTELASERGMYLEPLQAHAIRFLVDSEILLLKSRAYREDDPDTYSYPVEEDTADVEAHSGGAGLSEEGIQISARA
jgi:dTDP-4-dehydrorhamnose 3,5-epimerase-like enzyme